MSPPVQWVLEPSVIVGLFAPATGYLYLWRRARRPGEPHPPGYGRLALFAAGLGIVFVALESPIDSIAPYLMSIHMTQHIALLDIAPILMVCGLTKGLLRPVTRSVRTLERRAGLLAHPAFAVFAYVSVMWFWHVPALYDLTLQNQGVHVFEHLCFAAAGTLYWWHLLSPIRSRMRLGGMGPVAYMVSAKLAVGLLGVGLAFGPRSFYPWYQQHEHYWGLSPRADQNLAGLLMALEQSIVMGIALAYLFVRMLGESERQAQRAERFA